MFVPLLFIVVGAWAHAEDVYHLGDLPMENPDLFEGDILGIESPEDRNAIAYEQLRWPEGIIYYQIDHSLRNHLGDLPMQNPDLFEGDILGIDSPKDRNAIAYEEWRWPGGIIYYTIDPSIGAYSVPLSFILKDYEKRTCLKFVERTTEPDYVKIFKGQGCYSHVGKTGGEQPLSLGSGCNWMGTMAHEIAHAIGFLHEQNRSDRDDYIDIHWDNIQEGMEDQFAKSTPEENILYNEFEYESIMLYGEKAFSKDRKAKTMTAKKEGVRLREVYEKRVPTASDYYRINRMYNCVDKLGN